MNQFWKYGGCYSYKKSSTPFCNSKLKWAWQALFGLSYHRYLTTFGCFQDYLWFTKFKTKQNQHVSIYYMKQTWLIIVYVFAALIQWSKKEKMPLEILIYVLQGRRNMSKNGCTNYHEEKKVGTQNFHFPYMRLKH